MTDRDWSKAGDFTRKYFPEYPKLPLALTTKTYQADFMLEERNIRGVLPWAFTQHRRHLCLLSERKGSLRWVNSKGTLGQPCFCDLDEYPKTLQNLQRLHLDISKIISGHWSPVHGPELINEYLSMLKEHQGNE